MSMASHRIGSSPVTGSGRNGGTGASDPGERSPQVSESRNVGVEHNLPSIRNPFLIGRKGEIGKLRSLLEGQEDAARPAAVTLTGVAGVGKTQVALEYAYRYLSKYRRILWVDAGGRNVRAEVWRVLLALRTHFACYLANVTCSDRSESPDAQWPHGEDALQGPTLAVPDEALVAAALQDALAEAGPCLLILDGIEHPDQLTRLIPRQDPCHILLTSCRRDITGAAPMIIRELPAPEAAALAAGRQQLGRRERESLQALCAAFGHLPAALSTIARQFELQERLPSEVLQEVRRVGPLRWLCSQAEDPMCGGGPSIVRRLNRNYQLLSAAAQEHLHRLAALFQGPGLSANVFLRASDLADREGTVPDSATLTELIQLGFVQQSPEGDVYNNSLIAQYLRWAASGDRDPAAT